MHLSRYAVFNCACLFLSILHFRFFKLQFLFKFEINVVNLSVNVHNMKIVLAIGNCNIDTVLLGQPPVIKSHMVVW